MRPMFYFFLALTAILAVTATAAVVDTDGNPIRHGRYYVLPVIYGRGLGGGVTLTNANFRPCPYGDIVQAKSENDKGIPVRFSNWKPKVAFVPERQDLNIETDSGAVLCRHSTYWWLDEFNTENKNWFVVPGPKPEVHGQNSFRSYFQIQKSGFLNSYKIMFCPGNCIDVGIVVDGNGNRRLALSNEPFMVIFKKANETTTMDSFESM